jgi:hypothetical protein
LKLSYFGAHLTKSSMTEIWKTSCLGGTIVGHV